MVPPSRSTMALEMLSPSPEPLFSPESETSVWENFWKMRARNSSGTPGPRSRTSTRTRTPMRRTATVTVAPFGENLMAFERRLVTTWLRRSLSTLAPSASA